MGEKKDTIEKKIKILKIAEEVGVSKAAELYNLSRQTISTWKKRYAAGGKKALAVKSKKHANHPSRMPKEIEHKIISLKKRKPELMPAEIIKILNLNFSLKTVYKKIKEAGLSKEIKQSIPKERKRPFAELIINSKLINAYSNDDNCNLPCYHLSIEEKTSGIKFLAFSYEKTNLSLAIFADYFIETIKTLGIDYDNIIFYTSNPLALNSTDILNKIIVGKYNLTLRKLTDERKVNREKRKVKNLFEILTQNVYQEKARIGDEEELIYKSFAYLIYYNNDSLSSSKFCKQGLMTLRKHAEQINYMIYNLPPIIADNYISELQEILSSKKFWEKFGYRQKNKIVESVKYLEVIGDYAEKNYNVEKAIAFYDRILTSLKYIPNDEFEVVILHKKSNNLAKIEKREEVEKLLGRAVVLSKKIDDPIYLAQSYRLSANHYFEINDVKKCEKNIRLELELAIKINNSCRQITCYLNLGLLYEQQGRINKALKAYQGVIKKSDRCNAGVTIHTLNNICSVYMLKGERKISLEYCQKALNLANKHNDHEIDSSIYDKIGTNYLKMGMLDKARENFEIQMQISKTNKRKKDYLSSLNNLGIVNFDFFM